MRHSVLVLLVSTLALPAHAASIKPGPSPTDYMFQCGATFIIQAHNLENDGKPTKADKNRARNYTDRFNDLASKAEASFERYNRTRKEARKYLQQHVDEMSVIFADDPSVMKSFLGQCEKRFPDEKMP